MRMVITLLCASCCFARGQGGAAATGMGAPKAVNVKGAAGIIGWGGVLGDATCQSNTADSKVNRHREGVIACERL